MTPCMSGRCGRWPHRVGCGWARGPSAVSRLPVVSLVTRVTVEYVNNSRDSGVCATGAYVPLSSYCQRRTGALA